MRKPTPGEEMIELLMLCQMLQSDKDGLKPPCRDAVAEDEVVDTFTQRILLTGAHAALMYPLLDRQSRLADVACQLKIQGQRCTDVGENYALASLAWLGRLTGTGNTP